MELDELELGSSSSCSFIKAELRFLIVVRAALGSITHTWGARTHCWIFSVLIYCRKIWQGRVLSPFLPKYCFLLVRLTGGVSEECRALNSCLIQQQNRTALSCSVIRGLRTAAQLWAETLLHANTVFDFLCLLRHTVLRFWNLILVLSFKGQRVRRGVKFISI